MTATVQTSTTASMDGNDPPYRAWWVLWETALAAAGMIQTADTGQADSATLNNPGVANTFLYQVWKWNDGTEDVYVKVELGTGSAYTRPSMRLTFGTGTDGAGTITGRLGPSAPTTGSGSTWSTAGTSTLSVCATVGAFVAFFDCGSGGTQNDCWMVWQRRQDQATGDSLGTSDVVVCPARPTAISIQIASYTSGTTLYATASITDSIIAPMWSQSGFGSKDGANIRLYRPWTAWSGSYEHADAILAYRQGEITTGNTFDVETWDGRVLAYRATGELCAGYLCAATLHE